MATLPTDEDCARRVLRIYTEHFMLRAGEVLRTNNFMAYSAGHDFRTEDLTRGMAYAHQQGWIESLPNDAYRLTDAGFAEA